MSGRGDDEAAARVAKFLDRVNASGKCAYCGNTQWYCDPGRSTPHSKLYANLREHVLVPSYTSICTNCGLVKLHAKMLVDGEVKPHFQPGGNSSDAQP